MVFERLAAEATCRRFADLYNESRADLPKETLEGRYLDRMRRAYPIHPEVFDRLYDDWSTLDGFQRTRGVLKLMAKVIHRLWKDGNKASFILPGDLPLYDAETRNELIYYLPQGWDPVVEGDIDGERSEATEIDTQDTRFGSVEACRRLSRTIFLGSAPTTSNQAARGLEAHRILLGVLQPGQSAGVYKDALRRISDRLHYLNSGNDRYWFDVRPNLRREMEDRKRRFQTKQHVIPEIENRLRSVIQAIPRIAVHVFTESRDVPDDWSLHLVVLPLTAPFSRGQNPLATKAAQEILTMRGDQPRIKQNRLLYLAADADANARLEDLVCTYKAWESITTDIQSGDLNLDTHQSRQAQRSREGTSDAVNRSIRETFKWLLVPLQEPDTRGGISPLKWEHFPLNTGANSFAKEIEQVLKDNEIVIETWAPVHLENLLRSWFWKDGVTDIAAADVWQKTCQFLYMPRLKDSNVFHQTVAEGGASRDFFALAQGKRDGKYLSFSFGERTLTHLDVTLLIEPNAAAEYEAAEKARTAPTPAAPPSSPSVKSSSVADVASASGGASVPVSSPARVAMKRFFGTAQLDSLLAKRQFADIVDEIVQQFTTRVGDRVEIRVEIQAHSNEGFDENIQRTVRENCKTLKFRECEFETSE